jgi:zinc transporter ZupT
MDLRTLLLWSVSAALAAGIGAALGTHPWIAKRGIGWSSAAAAGLMLGAGYVLLTAGEAMAPAATLLGAALGLVLMRLADSVPRSADHSHPELSGGRVSTPPKTNAGAVLASTLHSAAEGIAIGAAAAVGAPTAQFVLLTFALHNVSEGAVLGARLTGTGRHAAAAALIAIAARASQPLIAVTTLLLTRTAPALLPWLIGGAFGALLYLIIAELLPQSYLQAGRTGIAVVVSLAAGMVALMGVAP